jgi:hypothetical protein
MELRLRSIGALIVGLTAFWCYVLMRATNEGKLFAAGLPDFLAIAYLAVPLVTASFGIAMMRTVVLSGTRHPVASWLAIILGISPLAFFAPFVGCLVITSE